MKTEATIRVEFEQTIRQAQRLEQCADELESVRRQLNALVNELRGSWEGESAGLYCQKCNELSEKLGTSRKNLDKTADVIVRSAKAYRDAELAAIQLVQD